MLEFTAVTRADWPPSERLGSLLNQTGDGLVGRRDAKQPAALAHTAERRPRGAGFSGDAAAYIERGLADRELALQCVERAGEGGRRVGPDGDLLPTPMLIGLRALHY